MKDQVFSGRTVAEAVDVAGRTLGLAPDAIRYVVLERETAGVLGLGGTPARIAVLLDSNRRAGGPEVGPQQERPREVRAAMRAFIRELAESGELDLTAEVHEEEEKTIVRLFGADCRVLLEQGGEVLLALDHIVQRAFAHEVQPRRLVLECEGFRDARDTALRECARRLADDVRRDGKARETEPLNSYERRIIHVAVGEMPGMRTYSVGEGSDRRVTIALEAGESAPEESSS